MEIILIWQIIGWHHNIQMGSSQIEELSTQNTSKDLMGQKIYHWVTILMKF